MSTVSAICQCYLWLKPTAVAAVIAAVVVVAVDAFVVVVVVVAVDAPAAVNLPHLHKQ